MTRQIEFLFIQKQKGQLQNLMPQALSAPLATVYENLSNKLQTIEGH